MEEYTAVFGADFQYRLVELVAEMPDPLTWLFLLDLNPYIAGHQLDNALDQAVAHLNELGKAVGRLGSIQVAQCPG